MNKKRSRLFLSITALMFCLGIMCFGVYAATSVSYTLSGHITYEVNDVFVDIETRHYLSTQTDLSLAKGEVTDVMQNIATKLESGTTSIGGVTELASDYDKQSTLNNVGGEELPLTGPELDITYGAYSNTSGQEKAYVHYIAILVTNYADEEINAILDLDSLHDLTGSNSAIYLYRTMENIPAKSGETNGVMSYVFALVLDNPAQSADVDFTGVELSVTPGNLDQYSTDGLVFEYSKTDGGYLVSDYTGTDTRVIVPSIVPSPYAEEENQPKNVVGTKGSHSPMGYAFDSTAIREIYIPKTFKTIGDFSFYGCSSLTSITIPESVTSIGKQAFNGCQLESVSYSIRDNSTYDFVNGTLTIKGEVSDYPAWYEANINQLVTNVVFEKSDITSIGSNAFWGCFSLTSITIPSSVESIGGYAFDGCTSLSEITIPSSVQSIGEYAFSRCTSSSEITISSSVESIGYWAFSGCTSLREITIPSSVTSIGFKAFYGCDNLISVDFEDETTPWTVIGTQIESADLSNPSTMATYLTKGSPSGYANYDWTKNV